MSVILRGLDRKMKNSPHLTHPKYREDIDGLRAVAILLVVGFHAFPAKIAGGFVGVDIFFVISGYLISTIIFSSLERDRFSLLEFYMRRVRRIFPALILVMLACLAFGWFSLLADEYEQLGKHVAGGAAFVQNFVLYGESGYFDTAAETKPLLHLWSLAIEEQFYIFWPLLLAFVWKRQAGFLKITAVIAAVSLAANIYLTYRNPTAAFYLPVARFWEMMAGGVLAYVAIHRPQLTEKYKNGQSALGFLLIIAAVLLLDKKSNFPGWGAMLPTLGAVFVISSGADSWLNRRILSNKAMIWVGLISYPLYLWHWPLLSFTKIIVVEGEYLRLIKVFAVGLAFLLAWITYRFVETYVRAQSRNGRLVQIILSVFISIGATGLYVYAKDGFPCRGNSNTTQTAELESGLQFRDCARFGIPKGREGELHCSYSDAGSGETVVVFGDSHASSAFPGIAEQLKRHSINALMLSSWGCPMLIGSDIGETIGQKAQCKSNTEQAIHAIAALKNVQKIFMFSRGTVYMTGKNYSASGQAISVLNSKISADEFVHSLQRTIDHMGRPDIKIYYVTENPELGFAPKDCISRPLRIGSANCELRKTKAASWQRDYMESLQSISNATLINSLDVFCPEGECLISLNGNLLYSDNNHISLHGSRLLSQSLSKYLID